MKYLVTAAEMKECDSNTINSIGIPGMVLMERAALAVRDVIMEKMHSAVGSAYILAGVGNNGGDGLALGRLLAEQGWEVYIQVIGETQKASEQWKRQRSILSHFPVEIGSKAPEKEYNINVDALFGVGLSREITGTYRDAIEQFNGRKGLKVAVDVPSGLNADDGKVCGVSIRADITVTFGFCKRGLVFVKGREYAGEVVTADIGIGRNSFPGETAGMFYYDENPRELLPPRDRSGNKGTFGKVLLVAGSHNMAGAAILAAKAAYRTGAGMVKVITSESNRVILQEAVPEALLGTDADLEHSLEWADVVAIGPGIGTGDQARDNLQKIIFNSTLPLVLDADALNLLAGEEKLYQELRRQDRTVILTPHVGELARLTKLSVEELQENLPEKAMEYARQLKKIVVAKDAVSFVCKEKEPIGVNFRGNSGMATAGSGDVLTGIVAALLAQGMDGFEAACVGTYLHACAGEAVAARMGEHACMAGDIAEAIGEI